MRNTKRTTDNPHVTVKQTGKHGKGVFATKRIRKGEVIAKFDGTIYGFDFEDWTKDLYNHVIQFAEDKWRDSKGLARYFNHSCEPNAGIKRRFEIVAMRDIAAGEEVVWDYGMTEDYVWRMKCTCGTPLCRKVIGSFKTIPAETLKKYKGYISSWLVKKYKI